MRQARIPRPATLTRFGETAVYKCGNPECGARFTFRPGFKKKRFSDAVITDVLVDAGLGHHPGRILERMEKNGVKTSDRTIRRWIKEYGEFIERFTATLPHDAGGEWATDEAHLKTHPKGSKSDHYLSAIPDNTTDLILSYEVAHNKPKYDAAGLANAAMGRTGRVPRLFIADRLSGYKKG